MRKLSVVLVAGALLLAACGDGEDSGDPLALPDGGQATETTQGGMAHGQGGGEHADHGGNPTSSCSPSGTSLSITASGTSFNKDCLAAPAGQPFTLAYDNKDPATHNIVILRSHTDTGQPLFRAPLVSGPKTETFNVGALPAGTYAFHCEVHPSRMSGTFVVR
jgi:plastocyanin